MNAEEKRLLRTIVKMVHPDLFTNHPTESACNSESLKLLNSYLDGINSNCACEEVKLKFWVSDSPEKELFPIQVELPEWGSLGPLFYAFDLIDEDQLHADFGKCQSGTSDFDVLSWLGSSADNATKAADEHEALRGTSRELRARLEDRFKLAAVGVGGEYSVSLAEHKRQIEALNTLETCLTALSAEDPDAFEGLSINVHHPDSENLDSSSLNPYGSSRVPGRNGESYVGEDGMLHVIADRGTIQAAVASLDLDRARVLTQVACFWVKRSRDLTAAVRDLLRVRNVWCDTRTEQSNQKFVLWAGMIFTQGPAIQEALRGQKFHFSLLVHCDESAPELDFTASSSTLQLRSDTSLDQLLEFMMGGTGAAADQAAAGVAAAKEEEADVLEQVREALGARHVIRVCSSSEQSKVISAAKRLLENADKIRAAGIDLRGASLAIDDCYEIWESGFISIPYDFQLHDLQPKLRKLLSAAPTQLPPPENSINHIDVVTDSLVPSENGADLYAAQTYWAEDYEEMWASVFKDRGEDDGQSTEDAEQPQYSEPDFGDWSAFVSTTAAAARPTSAARKRRTAWKDFVRPRAARLPTQVQMAHVLRSLGSGRGLTIYRLA